MSDDRWDGKLNLGRLDYGIIIQITETKDANEIRQYKAICFLKLVFKIITKVLMVMGL
jgi:hypothetical protein